MDIWKSWVWGQNVLTSSLRRVSSRLHLSCYILTRSLPNSNAFSHFVSFSQFYHKTSCASDFKKAQKQLFIALKLREQTLKGSKTFLFHLIVVTFILSCVWMSINPAWIYGKVKLKNYQKRRFVLKFKRFTNCRCFVNPIRNRFLQSIWFVKVTYRFISTACGLWDLSPSTASVLIQQPMIFLRVRQQPVFPILKLIQSTFVLLIYWTKLNFSLFKSRLQNICKWKLLKDKLS